MRDKEISGGNPGTEFGLKASVRGTFYSCQWPNCDRVGITLVKRGSSFEPNNSIKRLARKRLEPGYHAVCYLHYKAFHALDTWEPVDWQPVDTFAGWRTNGEKYGGFHRRSVT